MVKIATWGLAAVILLVHLVLAYLSVWTGAPSGEAVFASFAVSYIPVIGLWAVGYVVGN